MAGKKKTVAPIVVNGEKVTKTIAKTVTITNFTLSVCEAQNIVDELYNGDLRNALETALTNVELPQNEYGDIEECD